MQHFIKYPSNTLLMLKKITDKCVRVKKVANDAPTNILLWSEEALIPSGKPYISSEFWTILSKLTFI